MIINRNRFFLFPAFPLKSLQAKGPLCTEKLMPVNWVIRGGVLEMFNAEGGWVEGRQRSSFSRVILQRKGKVLGGSVRNGVCGRSVL